MPVDHIKVPPFQKPPSSSTLNKELQSLKRLFLYAASMVWVDTSPFLCIRPLTQKPRSERYYFKSTDLYNQYKKATDTAQVMHLRSETMKYRNYAAISGASSLVIAIPLNWNNIKKLWKN